MSLLGEEHTGVVDAVLLLSFGGPEGPEQVMPFLENVTGGRGIPRERLAAVAEHYLHFGGVSPINGINRALIEQLNAEFAGRGTELPVYFGNRNWQPYVEDAVAAMRDNGIRRAAVFTTSAWAGYSSCTQYVEDIARARRVAGADAPELVKVRQYFDHPLFVEMFTDAIEAAAQTLPTQVRAGARLAAGSDWAVTSADPLWGIHVAVNRMLPPGAWPPSAAGARERAPGGGPLLPDQALSLAEALAAYTAGSAYVNHLDQTGAVAPVTSTSPAWKTMLFGSACGIAALRPICPR